MSRVNYPMTIDELLQEVIRAKAKFGGDKYVLISNDEEGNGYHECYYTFGDGKEMLTGCAYAPYDLSPEECVTLG